MFISEVWALTETTVTFSIGTPRSSSVTVPERVVSAEALVRHSRTRAKSPASIKR